ncbi:hypothetical protein FNV43_RR24453 [Rhamnella rubrinervis]|uniref:KRR-R motif-containing protein 1 n=1 Tax=Rhamnella rubrinervis TaxID=2594499 RepID=A0A8K0DR77_9ROSA|nr:hypothetical protein FNV43_RR24453 [Rhamnella rubrinervis]
MVGKFDKPKPWDQDPNGDRWEVEKFDPSWNEGGMVDVTSFSTLFPEYRGKYLQDAWPSVKSALKEFGISCELNLTRDPSIIVKARDLIKLLARSVPAPRAIKVLNDDMQCDIIKIGNLVRNKEKFVKRRRHLIGANSSTLKALEMLTGFYILVQGNTVAAMGSFKGLKQVRKIVEDCIQNHMHPVFHIRTDIQLETGEYFLSEKIKLAKKLQERQEKQAEKTTENKRKREAAFIPPNEPVKQDIAMLTMTIKMWLPWLCL